jgi:hypothetical protein
MRSRDIPAEFFPGIPPDEFNALQKEQRAENRKEIRSERQIIRDLEALPSCEARYPPVEELEQLVD